MKMTFEDALAAILQVLPDIDPKVPDIHQTRLIDHSMSKIGSITFPPRTTLPRFFSHKSSKSHIHESIEKEVPERPN